MAGYLSRGVAARALACKSLSRLALAAALAVAPDAALAQSTGAADNQNQPADMASPATPQTTSTQSGLADIVVTAQRRAQNVQDVPISITAFSGDSLEKRDIVNIQQLSGYAPNVQIVSRRNASTTIAMRGTATSNPAIVFDPAVGLYIDGIYIGKSQGLVFDIADIANLEVLRGPQGTLFGRNTLAGAVNIVTEKPTGEFSGRLKVGYGNYDDRIARASIDLPAFGAFAVRISGFYNKRDGFVKIVDNPFPGVVNALPKSTNQLESRFNYGGRLAVRWEPVETLTVDYAGDYSRTNNRTTLNQLVSFGTGNIFDPASPLYRGALRNFGPANLYLKPNERQRTGFSNGGVNNQPLFERSRVWSHALTLTAEVGDTTLKSISAYRKMNFHQSFDLDGTPLPLIASDLFNRYKAYSQEFQATGKVGRLNYTGGLYYFRDSAPTFNEQTFFGNSKSATCANCIQALSSADLFYGFTNNAYAVYGQLEWNPPILDDKLVLVAGARYTKEDRSSRVSRTNYASGVRLPTSFVNANAKKSFSDVTPTLNVRYEFTPDISGYVRYAKGFKSGGFNGEGANPVAATVPYEPETIDSYELGLKMVLFDRKLRLNVALFNDEHKDQQVSVFIPSTSLASIIANAASSRIRGIEIDAEARPVDWLTLTGTLGTLSSKYKSFIDNNVDVSNNRSFPFAPKLTASATMDARIAQDDFSTVNLIVDYKHSDRFFGGVGSLNPNDRPNALTAEADRSDIVDARVVVSDIRAGGGALQFTAFVRNMFDQSNRITGTDYGASFGSLVIAQYNDPRTYGVTLGYRF